MKRLSKKTAAALLWATVAAAYLPATAQVAPCNSGENAVMCWARFAVESTTAGGRPPVENEYVIALASLAVWDAILAVDVPGSYEPYASSPHVVRPASSDGAVATAAFEVLRIRVPAQASVLQAKYDSFMATIADGPAKTNGMVAGLSAAQAVLAARAGDNFNNPVTFVQPPAGPGVFEPTLPSPPVSLVLATVQPLGNRNVGDFRSPPPPSLTSKQYADDFNEVKALGRATGSTRTPLQTETARFWSERGDVQLERSLRTLAQAKSLDSFETARLNSMAHGCVADASLEGFHTKYYYMFWRPFHSIPRADNDGNPETASDPGWTPLLNVNHPEYPSAHAFFTTAAATALKKYFNTGRLNWEISSTATGTTRVYTDLDDLVSEVLNARIYAGLHYRFSTEAGTKLGKQVCRNFLTDHLRRVDDDDQDDES